ncbi:MAG: hypothetical protein WDA22_12910 [Bacteroidota bacterium]
MLKENKQHIAHSPVFDIGVLPRSSIESAFDMIRGPAVANLQCNGIKNPREDIVSMEYHGSGPEGTSPPARGDTEHTHDNGLCIIRGRTALFRNARSDIAMHSVQYRLHYPVVCEGGSPEGTSPPARGDTEHAFGNVLCMIRGRTTLFRNARSDIAMRSRQNSSRYAFVYQGSSPPKSSDGNSSLI